MAAKNKKRQNRKQTTYAHRRMHWQTHSDECRDSRTPTKVLADAHRRTHTKHMNTQKRHIKQTHADECHGERTPINAVMRQSHTDEQSLQTRTEERKKHKHIKDTESNRTPTNAMANAHRRSPWNYCDIRTTTSVVANTHRQTHKSRNVRHCQRTASGHAPGFRPCK